MAVFQADFTHHHLVAAIAPAAPHIPVVLLALKGNHGQVAEAPPDPLLGQVQLTAAVFHAAAQQLAAGSLKLLAAAASALPDHVTVLGAAGGRLQRRHLTKHPAGQVSAHLALITAAAVLNGTAPQPA